MYDGCEKTNGKINEKGLNMKGIITLALCICAPSLAGVANAHQIVLVQQMTDLTGTGYNAKQLVWHDEDYTDAQPHQGRTNIGPWTVFPANQPRLLDSDGWVGPIVVNRWYRVKFSSFLLSDWSDKVFANPDICGPTKPPKHEQ